ncbi:MAG TPA: energy transducer TonB [Candidatus Polarisedimenticolaceae bacterium]|nr:energy transducer TonB [Candidatus Polarisedimenticolaceae bacterium]
MRRVGALLSAGLSLSSVVAGGSSTSLRPLVLDVPAVDAPELSEVARQRAEAHSRTTDAAACQAQGGVLVPVSSVWATVPVEVVLGGAGEVSKAHAADPELWLAAGAQLETIAGGLLPGEPLAYALREAAELAALDSHFAGLASRARIRLMWKVAHLRGFDPAAIAPALERSGPVLAGTRGEELAIVLMDGPEKVYHAEFPPEPTPEQWASARGLPATGGPPTACGAIDRPAEVAVDAQSPPQPPQILEKARPEYPEDCRRLRVGGRIVARAAIDETGTVSGVHIERGVPGFPSFGAAAVDAICRWRYSPQLRDGLPVPAVLTVITDFSVE